jgi:hypothetical protein
MARFEAAPAISIRQQGEKTCSRAIQLDLGGKMHLFANASEDILMNSVSKITGRLTGG